LAVDSNAKTLLWNSATMGGRTRGEETMGEQLRRRPVMFYTKTRPPSCNLESSPCLDFVPSGTSFFNVIALIDDQVNLSHCFFFFHPVPFRPPLYLLWDAASHHFQNKSPSTRESSTFLSYWCPQIPQGSFRGSSEHDFNGSAKRVY
jgi:hypothetical protein